MHTGHRPFGRAPAATLSLCLCVGFACTVEPVPVADAVRASDTTPKPSQPSRPRAPDAGAGLDAPPIDAMPIWMTSLPPLAYTLTLTYGTPPFIVPRPATITGHLYLQVDDDGAVHGTISTRDTDTVSLALISGHVQGAEIVIEDGMVAVTPGGFLGLDELRVTVSDNDGDGQADSAQGQATGSWQRAIGDIFDQTTHTSTVIAGLDTTATSASLFVSRSPLTLLPFEAVGIRFQEPLHEADVHDHLRVLANGAEVAGALTATATGGLVTGATFQPDAFLDFGAAVSLDLTGLQDPAGNPLTASGASVPVVAMAGPLTGNPGFESGLAGWTALGQAQVQGAFEGFAPVQGAAQAVVREGGTLTAPFTVPANATELTLSVTVLTEGSQVDADRTAVIALRKAGGALIEIFDVADVAGQLQPCGSCTSYGRFVGPLQRSFDLTPHRGQRVFLTVDVRSSFFFGVNFFAALVDDIQIH